MRRNEEAVPLVPLTAESLRKHWKVDLLSGFLVFLIALPLSLGIAVGSQFPPMSGILAAIVGGMIVSIFSGSHLTICGPAAGLIVVILHGVEVLGGGDPLLGYTTTLAAITIAGLIQVLLGLLRSGKLTTFFPGAVVHGMMSAIGLIIIVKQIHVLIGVKPQSRELLELITEIPRSLSNINPEIAIIGFSSLLLLAIFPRIRVGWTKKIPVPMLVVIMGIGFDKIFDLEHDHVYTFFDKDFVLGPKFLVQLPNNFMDGIVFPNWSMLGTQDFWVVTISIALVAALESLLSASAIQSMDPDKRKANFDKDLVAIGLGTTVSGLIGGLPMIAEIVRSSANVNNGARSTWSNFFHGTLMLLFVAGVPWLVQEIPLASLAALLVFVGFRLSSPREFVKIYKIGSDQFIIYVTTIITILATDLLLGVAVGILIKILIHTIRGLSPKQIFFTNVIVDNEKGEIVKIKILRAAVFWSIYKIKETLYNLPNAKVINVDLSDCKLVDHSMMEFFFHYKKECELENIEFNLIGLDHLTETSDHSLAARRLKN